MHQAETGSLDDLALVHQAKAGDIGAFGELVSRYETRIYRLARNIVALPQDAEDVVQNAFLKAYSKLDSFQENSKFYTWLVRIAVNEALMKLRRRKRPKTVSLDEPIDTGQDELPPIYRAVFLLRDVDGLSTEETAEALDLSIPAIKSRLLRARLKLRETLTGIFKRKGDDIFAYL